MIFLEILEYYKKHFLSSSRELKRQRDGDVCTIMKGGLTVLHDVSGRTEDAFFLLDSLPFWETIRGKPTR